MLYQSEFFVFEMLVSFFSLALKCARLVQGRETADWRPEYPEELAFFFYLVLKNYHPWRKKKQRKWKIWITKHLSVIHCTCHNNSFAAPWQHFNTVRLLHHIQPGGKRGKKHVGTGSRDATLFTLSQAQLRDGSALILWQVNQPVL